jgi:hypothetical protein
MVATKERGENVAPAQLCVTQSCRVGAVHDNNQRERTEYGFAANHKAA